MLMSGRKQLSLHGSINHIVKSFIFCEKFVMCKFASTCTFICKSLAVTFVYSHISQGHPLPPTSFVNSQQLVVVFPSGNIIELAWGKQIFISPCYQGKHE